MPQAIFYALCYIFALQAIFACDNMSISYMHVHYAGGVIVPHADIISSRVNLGASEHVVFTVG